MHQGRGRGARGGRGRGRGRGRGVGRGRGGGRGRGRGGQGGVVTGSTLGGDDNDVGEVAPEEQDRQDMSHALSSAAQRAASVIRRAEALVAVTAQSAGVQRKEARGTEATAQESVAPIQRGETLAGIPYQSASARRAPALPHEEVNTRPVPPSNIHNVSARLERGLRAEKLSQSMKPRGDIHKWVVLQLYDSCSSSQCLALEPESPSNWRNICRMRKKGNSSPLHLVETY